MPEEKLSPPPIFFEPHFDVDYDVEGPRKALAQVGAELDKLDPDWDAIRDWLSVPGAGFGRRFMVSTIIQKYRQAEAGRPVAEELRIFRDLLEGLRQPDSFSIPRIRELARELPASRLASGDPQERAAGERLRERFENF
jgi:hypothetical protein